MNQYPIPFQPDPSDWPDVVFRTGYLPDSCAPFLARKGLTIESEMASLTEVWNKIFASENSKDFPQKSKLLEKFEYRFYQAVEDPNPGQGRDPRDYVDCQPNNLIEPYVLRLYTCPIFSSPENRIVLKLDRKGHITLIHSEELKVLIIHRGNKKYSPEAYNVGTSKDTGELFRSAYPKPNKFSDLKLVDMPAARGTFFLEQEKVAKGNFFNGATQLHQIFLYEKANNLVFGGNLSDNDFKTVLALNAAANSTRENPEWGNLLGCAYVQAELPPEI